MMLAHGGAHDGCDLETREKRFKNGDYYIGGWVTGPEGEGYYSWPDGSFYEGLWKNGKKHGVGKYVWVSGATYQGEWKEGFMHGVGTFEGPNGSRYQGSWARDVKHGLGKQIFSNGDVYEGIWRLGLPEGPGRYKWATGCEYDGEWKAGYMHGKGTYVWPSGHKFDGEWKDGIQHGLGLFIGADASLYDGLWHEGRKHGVGIFRPAPALNRTSSTLRSMSRNMTMDRSKGGQYGRSNSNQASLAPDCASPRSSGRIPAVGFGGWEANEQPGAAGGLAVTATSGALPELRTPSLSQSQTTGSLTLPTLNPNPYSPPSVSGLSHASLASAPTVTAPSTPFGSQAAAGGLGQGSGGPERSAASMPAHLQPGGRASVRWYEHGTLVREGQLPVEEADRLLEPLRQRARPPKTMANGVKGGLKMGKTIREGHQSYNLMLALQLGIRYSVGRITTEPAPREPSDQDFQLKVKEFFAQEGSDMTPVHTSDSFLWKDYAPMVFRKLREIFSIDAGQYLQSLCGAAALRLLNTPGKSGAVFFLSQDDQFFVKTLKKGETKLLYNMLPAYYRHVESHPHTLLTKFYGLHRITLTGGRKFDFVVMANLFNTKMLLHHKFDLKGSTLGRTAGNADPDDPITIYKDLDLKDCFQLGKGWHERLMYQLHADCSLLEACEIMDYSMLLGIHYPSRAKAQQQQQEGADGATSGATGATGGAATAPDPEAAARNFDELDGASRYKEQYPALADKVAKLKTSEQTKSDLLQLITVRLMGTAHKPSSTASTASVSQSQPLAGAGPTAVTAEQLALQLGQSRVQLGVNLPAHRLTQRAAEQGPGQGPGSGAEEVVLYFGIIDILQSFNPSKRLEHRLKSIIHDSHSISVTHPHAYSQRFQACMRKTFVTPPE